MSQLSAQAQQFYNALRTSPTAHEPKPRNVRVRYVLFGVPMLLAALVALGIGFQFDPLHLGPFGPSKFLSAPIGVLIAAAAIAIGAVQLSWIHDNPSKYFLPGESKILLTSNERAELNQLRMDDQDAASAIDAWLSEGNIFAAQHLRACLGTKGITLADLDKSRLRSAWRMNLRFGLLLAVVFATTDFALYHFMPERWASDWVSNVAMECFFIAFLGFPFVEIYRYLANKRRHKTASDA